jgi:hypothetical protein
MSCSVEITPIYQEDPCGGEKINTKCITEESAFLDLGIESNSNQQEINQAIYNTLQASKATTNELQLQIDDLIPASYLVANLPIGALGRQAIVTDATAPTYLGILVGGGAVKCPVWHNGVSWVSR